MLDVSSTFIFSMKNSKILQAPNNEEILIWVQLAGFFKFYFMWESYVRPIEEVEDFKKWNLHFTTQFLEIPLLFRQSNTLS